jgi:hypothetical protein
MNDGRDIFQDILGEEVSWPVGSKIYAIVQLFADFVEDMVAKEENLRVMGKFHLGQKYRLEFWRESQDCSIFDSEEVVDAQT